MRFSSRISLGSVGLERVALLLSFIIPALIRWIPEAQFPYPIGFDTPLYMAYGKFYASNFHIVPLLYHILATFRQAQLNLLDLIKILPTLIYGALGLSVFLFCREYLGWNVKKSLMATLFFASSLVGLRLSWDMHNYTFGLTFLLIMLSQLKKLPSLRSSIIYLFAGLIASLSHEYIVGLLLATLIVQLVREVVKRRLGPTTAIHIMVLLAGGYALFGLFFPMYSDPLGYAFTAHSGLELLKIANNQLSLFLLSYFLLLPIAVLGVFREQILATWLLACLTGWFSPIINPWLALRHTYPLLFLAVPPVVLFFVNGLERLSLTNLTMRKFLLIALIFVVANAQTWGFLGISPTFSILNPPWARGKFPLSMAESSAPAIDISAVREIARWFDLNTDGKSSIIVFGNYLGWMYYFSNSITGPPQAVPHWGVYDGALESKVRSVIKERKESGDIYLLWYVDADARRLGFDIVYRSGPLSLYKYIDQRNAPQTKATP